MAGASLHGRRVRAEREAERIFEMSPALLAVAGSDGYLRRCNPAFEIFGYSREELFSRPWIEFAHPDDRERMMRAAAALARGDEIATMENRVVCRDGSLRWVEWNTRVVPEQQLFYAAGRDVTESRRAAEEQAALRRVATLVAHEAPPNEVFAAVGREVAELLGVEAAYLARYDADGAVVNVAQWGGRAGVLIAARYPMDGDSVSARVLRTGRPARMDGFENAEGVIASTVRELGIRFSVGVPILVEGQLWGVMIVGSQGPGPFPVETESRLQNFVELLATAIANASARDKIRVLADEQAALRRVATLVAHRKPQAEVFGAIAEEIGRLLSVDSMQMVRYQDDRVAIVVAGWGPLAYPLPIGLRVPLGGRNVTSLVFRTGRAARLEDYGEASGPMAEHVRGLVRAAVGAPIIAEGRLWGAMIAASTHEPSLPAETESRIAEFTELMATAIANAESQSQAARLAAEQAALRRVATLVAQGARPSEVFGAMTAEVSEILEASAVTLARYDDDMLLVLSDHGPAAFVKVGQRIPLGGTNATSMVLKTGRPVRMDDYGGATGTIGEYAREVGTRSVVAAPIVIDGRTWGVLAAVWADRPPPPDDTEERMARFGGLLETAIANADSREQLTASRARVLAAGDDARRRVVRDLHDGAQQRLVQTILALKIAQRALHEEPSSAATLLGEALSSAEQAMTDIRELAHGILPSVLARGGLPAAVKALVSRLELPVDADVSTERLVPDIEASAYFIVAEAITNVVKHARATRATVRAAVEDGVLTLEVRDDGVGGAVPEGHGLRGLADRVEALGGRLRIDSSAGQGTVLVADLPLSTHDAGA